MLALAIILSPAPSFGEFVSIKDVIEDAANHPPLEVDPNYMKIRNELRWEPSTPGLPGQCITGQREILYKLTKMRQEHPDWFEDIDFGPVTKEGENMLWGLYNTGHEAVAVYRKQKGPDADYSREGLMEAIKDSMVFDYTNYTSNMTGLYRESFFDVWRWFDFKGKGTINDSGQYIDRDGKGFTYKDTFWRFNPETGQMNYPDAFTLLPPSQFPMPEINPQVKITFSIPVWYSIDPNEKTGAKGTGADHFISGNAPLRYTIFFENMNTATAPAQQVAIEDYLDMAHLNFPTFNLETVAFGSHAINIPSGQSSFTQTVDLRPDNNLLLKIEINLDKNTGLLAWHFKSLDPLTGELPEDPLAGFLPPNVNPPEGQGSVMFSVMLKNNVPSGTAITNNADIVFDYNDPIRTNDWVNVVDKGAPQSQVLPLAPVQTSPMFEVNWSGTDPVLPESGDIMSMFRKTAARLRNGCNCPWIRRLILPEKMEKPTDFTPLLKTMSATRKSRRIHRMP